jgi:hypothetical protein
MKQVDLGDGLCASFDGEFVWLKTSSGAITTNEVALEQAALDKFLGFLKTLSKTVQEAAASVPLAASQASGSPVGHNLR